MRVITVKGFRSLHICLQMLVGMGRIAMMMFVCVNIYIRPGDDACNLVGGLVQKLCELIAERQCQIQAQEQYSTAAEKHRTPELILSA